MTHRPGEQIDKHSCDRRLSESQITLLVEYLDGELPAEKREEVEAWLERDEVARQELELLRRVDDYVDYLPRARARPGLTEQTRSMVARLAPPVAKTPPSWFRPLTVIASLVLFGGGCALFGATLRQVFMPRNSQIVLRNLELLEHLPLLREIGTRERLDVILESGMFEQRPTAAQDRDSGDQPIEANDGTLPSRDH